MGGLLRLSTYADLLPIDNSQSVGVNYFTREISIIQGNVDYVRKNPAQYYCSDSTLFTRKSSDEEYKDFLHWFMYQASDLSCVRILWALTSKCNLSCIYCYEDGGFKDKVYYCSPNLIDQIARIFKNYKCTYNTDELVLMFYGGEPTLETSNIINCVRTLSRLGLGVNYSIFTNAYNIPVDLLKTIVDHQFAAVQVTIDGEKNIHDKMKPTRSGKGSFDRVFSNLLKLLRTGVNVTLNMNFNVTNVESIKSFLKNNVFLREFPTLEVAFAPVFVTKHKEPVLGDRRSWKEIGADWYALICLSHELGYRTDLLRLLNRGLCSYHSQNTLIVHPSGSIYKCIGASGEGPFYIGNLETALQNLRAFHEEIRNRTVIPFDNCEKCRVCKFLPICLGGCRFHAIEENGSIQNPYCHWDLIDSCDAQLIRYAATAK